MASILQLKLRGITTAVSDDMQEKWKQIDSDSNISDTAGNIFTQILSSISNFFTYLITWFDNKFPPETRDEQIHHWFDISKPYLIAAGVLILFLFCCGCLLPCLRAIFNCLFAVVRSIFMCLRWCLCCGGRSAAKMMKAPGRAAMRIKRGSFEANPRGYFRDLRGHPNDFVY